MKSYLWDCLAVAGVALVAYGLWEIAWPLPLVWIGMVMLAAGLKGALS